MSVSPSDRPAVSKARRAPTIPLMVDRDSGLFVTARGFWRLCRANPDLRLERSAKGEVIVMAPAGSDSGRKNADLTAQLWAWNQSCRLGVVFDSSAGFKLRNGQIVSPDATWIARDRWLAVPASLRSRFAPICPDFVGEIRSPSDGLVSLRLKLADYLEQGVRLGWLLDPITARVEIYRPGRAVETLNRPATLSGEDVLPGFVLDLSGILFD